MRRAESPSPEVMDESGGGPWYECSCMLLSIWGVNTRVTAMAVKELRSFFWQKLGH
jgi:hypothetical protein